MTNQAASVPNDKDKRKKTGSTSVKDSEVGKQPDSATSTQQSVLNNVSNKLKKSISSHFISDGIKSGLKKVLIACFMGLKTQEFFKDLFEFNKARKENHNTLKELHSDINKLNGKNKNIFLFWDTYARRDKAVYKALVMRFKKLNDSKNSSSFTTENTEYNSQLKQRLSLKEQDIAINIKLNESLREKQKEMLIESLKRILVFSIIMLSFIFVGPYVGIVISNFIASALAVIFSLFAVPIVAAIGIKTFSASEAGTAILGTAYVTTNVAYKTGSLIYNGIKKVFISTYKAGKEVYDSQKAILELNKKKEFFEKNKIQMVLTQKEVDSKLNHYVISPEVSDLDTLNLLLDIKKAPSNYIKFIDEFKNSEQVKDMFDKHFSIVKQAHEQYRVDLNPCLPAYYKRLCELEQQFKQAVYQSDKISKISIFRAFSIEMRAYHDLGDISLKSEMKKMLSTISDEFEKQVKIEEKIKNEQENWKNSHKEEGVSSFITDMLETVAGSLKDKAVNEAKESLKSSKSSGLNLSSEELNRVKNYLMTDKNKAKKETFIIEMKKMTESMSKLLSDSALIGLGKIEAESHKAIFSKLSDTLKTKKMLKKFHANFELLMKIPSEILTLNLEEKIELESELKAGLKGINKLCGELNSHIQKFKSDYETLIQPSWVQLFSWKNLSTSKIEELKNVAENIKSIDEEIEKLAEKEENSLLTNRIAFNKFVSDLKIKETQFVNDAEAIKQIDNIRNQLKLIELGEKKPSEENPNKIIIVRRILNDKEKQNAWVEISKNYSALLKKTPKPVEQNKPIKPYPKAKYHNRLLHNDQTDATTRKEENTTDVPPKSVLSIALTLFSDSATNTNPDTNALKTGQPCQRRPSVCSV